jgi:hypothetical protein
MTLFEELGVEYKEVDGILYPLLSVDEAEYNLTDIGIKWSTVYSSV